MTYDINLRKLNLPIVMTMYSEELDRIEKKTPEQMLKVEFEGIKKRRIWHNKLCFFSVIDAIQTITDSGGPGAYIF